jgi:hypothetical protein
MRSGALSRVLALSLTTGTGLIAATAVADATTTTGHAVQAAHPTTIQTPALQAVLTASLKSATVQPAAVHHKAAKKAVHKKAARKAVHKAAIPDRLNHQLAALRSCESSGNYRANTGNGFYGAYQFDAGTWRGLGYHGLPSDNSADAQDEAAVKLHAARGWQPWPSCSRSLGLR